MLFSLTGLVRYCGHTNATMTKQQKEATAVEMLFSRALGSCKDVALVYPDYSRGFELHTEIYNYKLGAVIPQRNFQVVFWLKIEKNSA